MKLLDRLRKEFPTAKQQTLRRMVQDGRVLVNGTRTTRADQNIADDDRVLVRPPEKLSARLPFPIAFEDRDLLVIDKPAGILTSTNARETRPTAFAAVREYVQQTDPAAHRCWSIASTAMPPASWSSRKTAAP